MFKNTSSQKLTVYCLDASTNLAKTGDAANLTAYVVKDFGAVTILTDTSATELDATNAKGYYLFDLSQSETSADTLIFSCKSSTSNVVCVAVPAVVFTRPPNFSTLSIDSNGRVDVIKIAGTTQTARDIGASVLLSTGTGTGQLDFTSGVVKSNVTQLLGTAWLTPGTAGTPDVNVKLWNALTTVALPLVPTTAGRTLDVSVGGEAGLDWANIGSPTTTVALTGTTIAVTQKVDVDTIKTNPVVNAGTITFPTTTTLASTTNITAGTVTTATNVTTLNGIAANVITAASIADAAIDRATFAVDTGLQTVRSNTAQTGASGTITLDASASATTDFYKGMLIYLTGATGVGQYRLCTAYNGSTKVATITPAWATNPDVTSTFAIIPRGIADAEAWLGGVIAAVNVTGVPLVDNKYLLGTVYPTPTVAGVPNVNVKTWNDLTTIALPLIPTTAGRTLDVSATGEAGLDWANIGSPTTTVALTGTTIAVTQKVDVDTIKTNPVVNGGTITFPTTATLASTTNITAGTITTATNLTTNNDKTGYSLAANDSPVVQSGTAQAGGASTITLSSGASATDNIYNGQTVKTTGGTGPSQVRVITGYVGSTKVATVDRAWQTNPDVTTTYAVLATDHPKTNSSLEVTASGITGVTYPTNFSSLSIDGSGRVDIGKTLGTAVTLDANSVLNVSAKYLAGTALTGRDIGASVLLSTGTGTGQIDFTSGVVKVNVTQLLGTAWLTPGTAGTPDVNVKLWNGLTTVALPLVSTTAGRTLDVSATGEAGLDWANIGSPTTTVALTGTTIATTQKVDIETIKTNPVVNAGTVTFPTTATLASTTNITGGTITTVTNLTNAATSGDLTSTMKTSVENAVWDATTTSHLTANTFGRGAQPVRESTAQAGASTTITLDASASASNSFYNNCLIKLIGGTGSGQSRFITGYVGSTKVATVNSAWVTNPDNTTTFSIQFFDAVPGASAPTAAQVATAVWQDATASDFTTVGSIGKSLFTSGAVPGAAGGLFIAGTNAATTITTALTANITGNLSGSVGSLTTNNDKTGYSLTQTFPTNFSSFSIDASGRVDIGKLLGTAWLTPGTAGTPDVNVKLWNGLTTVALPLIPTTAGRTLDVSATGEAGVDWANVGSPTSTVNLSATNIAITQKVDVDTIKTNPVANAGTVTFPTNSTLASTTNITAGVITTVTTVTNQLTAAQVATGVWQDAVSGDFTAASSIGKSLYTGGSVPGAASGFFIAGSNATTTVNFTGNLSGSVGSVTGLTASNLDATITSRAATSTGGTIPITGGGLVNSDVAAIATSTTAASLQKSALTGIWIGSVTSGGSTTTLIDSTFTQTETGHFNGRIALFTSGAMKYQAAAITAYNASTKQITFSSLTSAPSNGDTYVIL